MIEIVGVPLAHILFEIGIYIVAIIVFIHAWHQGRRQVFLFLSLMVAAGAIEAHMILSVGSYYYAPFLLMVGTSPFWFPVCIAVAWGVIWYYVMMLTDRIIPTWYVRPLVDALLAVSIDLVLDPAVAGNVACDTSIQAGSAPGLGLWVWCKIPENMPTIFKIPLANFHAWFLMTGITTFLCRAVDRWGIKRGGPYDGFRIVVIAVMTVLLVSFFVEELAARVHLSFSKQWFLSEWMLLWIGIVAAVSVLVLNSKIESVSPIHWHVLLFPFVGLAYCWLGYIVWGTEDSGFYLGYLVAATTLSVGLHLYVSGLIHQVWRKFVSH